MSSEKGQLSRRNFLVTATAVGAGTWALPAHAQTSAAMQAPDERQSFATSTVAFDDAHQAGIATPAQQCISVIGYDLRAGVDRAGAQRLLKVWTEDARRLTQGQNPLGNLEKEMVTTPANLTVTCGFGPRFLDKIDAADKRPEWLQPLPEFSKDRLDPRWGQTDLVLQVCSDDPLTNAFASRHFGRAGVDYVQPKWVQQGFLNANGIRKEGQTPRNLFGQLDGTINPHSEKEFQEQIWIDSDDDAPEWMHGGTCMVVRRIHMNLDTWEELDRGSREVALGRTLDTGAPLSGGDEHTAADFEARDEYGLAVIDPNSHMALASPHHEGETDRLLRRAYNFNEAPEPGSDQLSQAGLVFCCFQKDPREQFIAIQQRLNDGDRLNTWITHIGSAVYAVPPGTTPEQYWGQSLFEQL